jgi:hypothetical protein
MKYIKLFLFVLMFVFSNSFLGAQSLNVKTDAYKKGWHLEDHQSTGIYGISLEKAYTEFLAGKNPKKKVIVAVIDSGIDTTHEDLKPVLWQNRKEILENGIDI